MHHEMMINEERVLVLAPTTSDQDLSRAILTEAGLQCRICHNLDELAEQVSVAVGAVLLTDQALAGDNVRNLVEALHAQPAWSDVPIVLLSASGEHSPVVAWTMEQLGNVTILEQPVRITTLISALRSAIRARRRQYELRDQVEALERSEERFRTLADNIAQFAWTADKLGWVTWYNKRWYEYTGTTWENMQDRGWERVLHPDHLERVRKTLAASLENGEVWEDTFPLKGKDGQYRWFLSRAVPIRDQQGNIVRWFGTNTDVTEQLATEEALRNSESWMRQLLALMPMAVYTCDAAGRITYFNPQAALVWGREPQIGTEDEKFCGSYRLWMHDGRPLPHTETAMAKAIREGTSARNERVIIEKPDGTHITVSVNIDPLYDADGKRIGAINVFQDVTEYARSEEALANSEKRFRTMANTTPAIIWTANPSGAITFHNQRWLDYTGISPEDNRQNWPALVLHPDDRQRCSEEWARALEQGTDYEIEVRNRRHDGEYRWFLTRATPIRDADGTIIEWYGSTTDIHDRKLAEEALKDADRRKDEFLAMLAHELRNPLAPIRTGLQIIQLCGDDRETASTTLQMMDRQLRQLVRLIDDLLDISRITRGKIELRREPCELGTILSAAIESCRPAIEEAGVGLTVSTPRPDVDLFADPARLSQVFSNLLTNAAKYTERGGHIYLTAERRDNSVLVSVRDTGIGIRKDMLTRVFDMFTQVDSGERGRGGLGIGLSLVKALVELHEGTVEALSDGPGQGSEFIVRLPIQVEQARRTDNRQSTTASKATCAYRVLVADDNKDAAKSLAQILTMMDNDVRTAHDGLEAVQVAEKFRPEIVLIDLGMPYMDGYEAAQRIREQPWGRDMVLVAVTGWGQEQDRQRSKQAGFNYHCVKPVDVDVLQELLAQMPTKAGKRT